MTDTGVCPHLRSDPDGTRWCGLAERDHQLQQRLRENFDRAISFSWLLEELTDRMAAACTDPTLTAELVALKEKRTKWAIS